MSDCKKASLLVISLTTHPASFPADGAHFFRVTVAKPSDATAKAE